MRQEVIDRILEAPLAERPWAPLFPALQSLANGLQSMMRFTPVGSQHRGLIRSSADDVPGGAATLYRDIYQFHDPVRYEGMSPGVLYAFSDMIDLGTLSNSLFYRAFCEPMGFRHAFFCYLGRFEGTDVWMNGAREGAFSPREREALEATLPFVTQAARYYCRTESLRAQNAILADATAKLGLGVVMLDAGGAIVETNAEVEAIFAAGGPVSRAGDRLRLPAAASQALSEALAEARSGQCGPDRFLTLGEDAGDRISLLVKRASDPGGRGHGPVVVLYLRRDRMPVSDHLVQSAQDHFGLTRSEARVTLLLASGHSLAEAARILNLTSTTAQTYCKRALEKTGASRQAELVRLVLSSLAALA